MRISGRFLPPAVLFLTVLLSLPGLPSAPVSAEGVTERKSEVHSIGSADASVAYEAVRALLGERGRAILDEGHHTIIVLDAEDTQAEVRALLASLQSGGGGDGGAGNVTIEVRFTDVITGGEAVHNGGGHLIVPFEGDPSADLFFEASRKDTTTNRRATQNISVVNGGRARISVGRQIPFKNWLYSYGKDRGFITVATAWKEVGSSLEVQPALIAGGKSVRLRLTPRFDYMEGKKEKSVSFSGLTTEVVVPVGEEVRLGGAGSDADFYSRFFSGYDRQRRIRRVDVFLRVSVPRLQ